MLLKVASDDAVSFKNNNAWLKHHPGKAKIFAELDLVWKEIRSSYIGDFSNLVFGSLPDEKDTFLILQLIKNRLKSVQWLITETMK